MKKRLLGLCTLTLLIMFSFLANAAEKIETKPYTLDDAIKAPRIRYQSISDDGNWITYTVMPDRGDGKSYIRHTGDSLIEYTFERGRYAKFSPDENWAATLISPKAIDKENKVKDKSKLKNSLELINLGSGERANYKNVKSFKFTNSSQWLVFQYNINKKEYSAKDVKQKPQGSELVMKHLGSGTDLRMDYVSEFYLDSTSYYAFYCVSSPDGDRDGLYYRDYSKVFAPEVLIAKGDSTVFGNLSWNHKKSVLAYTESQVMANGRPDSTCLKVWLMPNAQSIDIIIDSEAPEGYFIPFKNDCQWTEDGKRLFFGFKPITERDTTTVEKKDDKYTEENFYDLDNLEEKADVLVWHWNDDRISPHQIKWSKDNKDRLFYSVYHLETNKWVQLADLEHQDVTIDDNPKYVLIYDSTPYLKEITWEGWFHDIYIADLNTGKKTLIERHAIEAAHISPTGNHVAYFKSKNWRCYNTQTKKKLNTTGSLKAEFFDNTSELPAEPGSFGFVGWHKDDLHYYVYDEYDLWRFNCDNDGYLNMNAADGRHLNRKYRIKNYDKDKKYFEYEDTLLVECYYNERRHTNIGYMTLDICSAVSFYLDSLHTNKFLGKAKNKNIYMFSREAYDLFPDIWVGSGLLNDRKQISDVYPEMKDFEWGKSERCTFTNSDGDEIKGYIIKPEGFDPDKKHPLLVYIYEKWASSTYRYYYPRVNHRPCYQVYNSKGYVIFVPDIKYHVGEPGPDALDCVLSGLDYMLNQGYVDSNRVCLQGHSWGAYQAAYIATQTDRFAAICAGAPVGNMTSAYSGIRLGSGLARQFQYEKFQSRIGGSLFESFENYLANSPVFETNKASVPLLILHGDNDGAVPWEQSIEIYLAYRRLGKNCIFLQYENEPHWPSRYPNKVDWSKKMHEFFDTYCLEEEAPKWMLEGEPYDIWKEKK